MRFHSLIASAVFALAASVMAAPAFAAGDVKHPRDVEWHHDGPFGQFDRAALQRGFQVYKEVCAVCHAMEHLRYRNLGEPGGPFAMVAPRGWDKEGIAPVFGVPGHGKEWVNANKIPELDRTSGDMIERDGRPADRFKAPFENPFKAAAALGAAAPDLSVITKARANGENYVYSLLTGYKDVPEGKSPPGGATNLHYNPYFAGGWIAMARPLNEDQVTYADGTKATVDQMAKDVTTFLAWAGDPKAEERRSLGFMVLIYLLILTGFLYVAYKQVWRNEKH
jgi:ubiquinol-cytochrome c reductase cytochrome c1 subunit